SVADASYSSFDASHRPATITQALDPTSPRSRSCGPTENSPSVQGSRIDHMAAFTGDDAAITVKQRTFLGHPVGLYVLFFTEMWERFSYYGMRALLMLYMVNYFKWTQKESSGIYKWYTSLVYLT